jgi:hypothetical protein
LDQFLGTLLLLFLAGLVFDFELMDAHQLLLLLEFEDSHLQHLAGNGVEDRVDLTIKIEQLIVENLSFLVNSQFLWNKRLLAWKLLELVCHDRFVVLAAPFVIGVGQEEFEVGGDPGTRSRLDLIGVHLLLIAVVLGEGHLIALILLPDLLTLDKLLLLLSRAEGLEAGIRHQATSSLLALIALPIAGLLADDLGGGFKPGGPLMLPLFAGDPGEALDNIPALVEVDLLEDVVPIPEPMQVHHSLDIADSPGALRGPHSDHDRDVIQLTLGSDAPQHLDSPVQLGLVLGVDQQNDAVGPVGLVRDQAWV